MEENGDRSGKKKWSFSPRDYNQDKVDTEKQGLVCVNAFGI